MERVGVSNGGLEEQTKRTSLSRRGLEPRGSNPSACRRVKARRSAAFVYLNEWRRLHTHQTWVRGKKRGQ